MKPPNAFAPKCPHSTHPLARQYRQNPALSLTHTAHLQVGAPSHRPITPSPHRRHYLFFSIRLATTKIGAPFLSKNCPITSYPHQTSRFHTSPLYRPASEDTAFPFPSNPRISPCTHTTIINSPFLQRSRSIRALLSVYIIFRFTRVRLF